MENWLAQHLGKLPLGVYDGREIGPWEGLTVGFIDGKVECLLLGVWLGSFGGLKLGPNSGIGLDKSLSALDGLLLGKYDGMELEPSQ